MQTYKEIRADLLRCLDALGWDVRTCSKTTGAPLKIPHATRHQDSGDTVRLFFRPQSIHAARYSGQLRTGQSDASAGLTIRESRSICEDIKYWPRRPPGAFTQWANSICEDIKYWPRANEI